MHECDIMTGLVVYKKSDALFTGTHDIVAQAEKLNYSKWIEEGNRTWRMRKILESIENYRRNLDLIFLTGNSHDWVRGRIIENFVLYDIPNVDITVISENGLVAQSRDNGVYWIGDPSDEYNSSLDAIIEYAHGNFNGLFWLQGNMRRTSLKPVSSYTDFDIEFVPQIVGFAEAYGIIPFDIERGFGDENGVIYHHHGSSIDIDPRKITIAHGEDAEIDFRGKETAVKMLSEIQNYDSVACIARAASDYPMMEAISKMGGNIYIPRNHKFPTKNFWEIKRRFNIQIVRDSENILSSVLGYYRDKLGEAE